MACGRQSKTNYRPVSVLPVFSKNFEKVFETQLSDFFDTIFNPFCVLSDVDMDARPSVNRQVYQ
jgi:hypothetical protein